MARPLLSPPADEFFRETSVKRFILISAAMMAFAAPALADPLSSAGDFERPFGMDYESFDTPIEASTRDENGNRVIINGRMQLEGTLSGGLMDSYGSAQAIGNQLNVVTQGNWNTVIVDSTQVNNGDVSAVVQGDN
jgi:holdfast attachment protein HfaA